MEKTSKFSDRLKFAIDISGKKQIDIANLSGISKSLLNKYLKGASEAGNLKLAKLADVLNVDPVWLMGYDVPMERGEITKVKNDKLNAIISSVEKLSEEDLEFVSKFLEKMSNNKK